MSSESATNLDTVDRSPSPIKSMKHKGKAASNIIVTLSDDSTPSLLILDDPVNSGCDLKSQTQSLKHLSASAPAMRTDLGKQGKELFMEPSSSKSRQKKFHRHFKTVPQDEKVLEYYSCALVGDILLQGFLYISENYFAFYSNVFGYVTKLLIPVSTIVNITKERTAKIFPNAVGIQTQSERHVFASLISRDTTHKLMCKVWMHSTKQIPSDSLIIPKDSDKGLDDTSGDIVMADDSTGDSGSGNDSALEPSSCSPSPQNTPGFEKLLHAKLSCGQATNNNMIAQLDATTKLANGSVPSPHRRHVLRSTGAAQVPTSELSTTRKMEGYSQISKTFTNSFKLLVRSTKSNFLLILATALLVILFLSAAFLLIRISNLQQKMNERPVMGLGNSEQFYEELLAWQGRLHSNSAEEIHQFIDNNLQQIVKVRESLEALSTVFLNGQQNTLFHSGSTNSPMSNTES